MVSTSTRSVIHQVWALLLPSERRDALLLLILMVIAMLLETLGVGLVIPALVLLSQGDLLQKFPIAKSLLAVLGYPDQHSLVVIGMLSLTGMYLIKSLFLALLAWRQTGFAFGVQENLSQRLFATYLRQSYPFHLQRNSAQLIRNVTFEVGMFSGNALLPGMLILTESFVMVGLCALLLMVEPIGALIIMSVLGAASWGFYSATRARITRWGKARQFHDGLRLQHLQQGLGGVKEVKLLGRESEFLEQFGVHNARSVQVGRFQNVMQQLPRLWLELLAVSGLAILVITMLAQGRTLDTVLPTLGVFAATAFRLLPSVNRVLGAAQALRFGLPVIDILYHELACAEADAKVDMPIVSPVATRFASQLHLDKVRYSYPGAAEPALRDITLMIRQGESVGFVGTSGAGKSTLVDVLLGLLPPDSGRLLVDGKDICGAMRQWQDQIGYVPQTIFLTDDTLRRNVAFGLRDEQIDHGAVERALKAAQLDAFVATLPNGLDTPVGERGIQLSGGQRQRIGIARALYHDPAVLVLDEATSALDIATERDVMQAVTALQGTKTILIVAHRLSTVEHCDRLCWLEQGRILRDGLASDVFAAMEVAAALELSK